jgi:pimeloyl-ACP methyl ester carboxylesterase
MSMIARALSCLGPHGFHRLHYWEWPGPESAPTLLCVHGLTRNGRDFDELARALSARYRVVCPDMPGRGRSEWLSEAADYGYPVYLTDIAALIARLDVETVDWVGTSMGGLIGMLMASQKGAPIRRLVINDIGPLIANEGLARIGSYVGQDPEFRDIAELEAVLRGVAQTFGPLSDAEWRHLATHSAREKANGQLGFAYDPRIGDPFRASPPNDIDLWASYDVVACPTLVLRGAESDLLRRADAEAMTRRGPKAKLVEFAGIGHAPALMAEDQIAAIRDFLYG